MNERSENVKERDEEDQTRCPSASSAESAGHGASSKQMQGTVIGDLSASLERAASSLVTSRSSAVSQSKRTLNTLAVGTKDGQRTNKETKMDRGWTSKLLSWFTDRFGAIAI